MGGGEEKTCSICLATVKQGGGQAVFIAECSDSFHYHCIVSYMSQGNLYCPTCSALWKSNPFQPPNSFSLFGPPMLNPHHQNPLWNVPHPPHPSPFRNFGPPTPGFSFGHTAESFPGFEPPFFNDDESLVHQLDSSDNKSTGSGEDRTVKINIYPEYPVVSRSSFLSEFTALVHLNAPASSTRQQSRAPVDLVMVLDISGSMSGNKIVLLKQAMDFVIQNLSPNDRLSVVAFSSTAKRLFPLRRMSETERQRSLRDVNSLVADGGTNIAEGLRKGAKILEERRQKNPVASIMLLSDGQDNFTNSIFHFNRHQNKGESLLPMSMPSGGSSALRIPVHTFGFGADHDAALMHSIAEMSRGTFSFIEKESVIQDAFAQCIGGLLSVVVNNMQLSVECVHPNVQLKSLKTGSYPSRILFGSRMGTIDVGDLYADEERDFLVSINVPFEDSNTQTPLLKVGGIYNDPFTKETRNTESEMLVVPRPEEAGETVVSIEVDRQQNRLRATEAMAQAKALAESGNLAAAVAILELCRVKLSESVSGKSRDRLCLELEAELKEMQERMKSQHAYETSGRAYMLSGMSSHVSQRAAARGNDMRFAGAMCGSAAPAPWEQWFRALELQHNNVNRLKSLLNHGHVSRALSQLRSWKLMMSTTQLSLLLLVLV